MTVIYCVPAIYIDRSPPADTAHLSYTVTNVPPTLLSTMSAEEPVRLIFDPSTKVAGQVIEGAVDLHWPTAIDKNIEEVILKLRGEINTYVERILSGAPLTCPFI